uniref:C2H2-type domain-containing protein n=1 Tax=Octopus bimaculoides TaxID=37653 RepID=A0A0L8HL53_OCTBM
MACLACLVMYSQLEDGRCSVSGQHKCFKDHLKAMLKKCHIIPDSLESVVADCTSWHNAYKTGTTKLQEDLLQSEVARYAWRYVQNLGSQQQQGFTCSTCRCICLSRIGLYSHQRSHNYK